MGATADRLRKTCASKGFRGKDWSGAGPSKEKDRLCQALKEGDTLYTPSLPSSARSYCGVRTHTV